MLSFILKNLESFPAASFTETELVGISRSSFNTLTKQKCLSRLKYDALKEPYYLSDDEKFIKKRNGRYFAYSAESADVDPVEVKESDLKRYQLSFPTFFEKVRLANNIEGKFQEIKDGYFYIGYKVFDSFRVGFVFAPKIKDGKLVEFTGLKELCKDDKVLVVFTPFTKIENIELNYTLSKCMITTASLASSLNAKTYKLPVNDLFKEFTENQITELTAKQKKDYETHGYKCYDKMHIPGTFPRSKSNDIVINGHASTLPDEAFLLFLELLVGLKKNKGGWITKYIEAGKYQTISRLRTPLKGSLLQKDAKAFIESGGSKQYRISTHPDFVTYDKKALLKHPDSTVRALAKKLRKVITPPSESIPYFSNHFYKPTPT
ncbi:MAG: hypothetical protein HQ579_04730 [Candidatus Omnitrophica bacterium]|nr:hypothetical protein [Candidatus Omnitrophota bacterium]